MTHNSSRHDAWSAGDSYETYMGRWSRQVALQFLGWLTVQEGREWLDVGCGTGALSSAILKGHNPKNLIGVDSSQDFVALAAERVADRRAEFRVGDAQALPLDDASRDVVASALMLNFVPDKQSALAEMMRVVRPGGIVAFYVWDYPGGGVEFMSAFWSAAIALDPDAAEFAEDARFSECTADGLAGLASRAGLERVEAMAIEVPTIFESFEDYWRPVTLGAGPAPGYCVSLEATARGRLRDRLQDSLPRREDGSIALKARAWAIKAAAT